MGASEEGDGSKDCEDGSRAEEGVGAIVEEGEESIGRGDPVMGEEPPTDERIPGATKIGTRVVGVRRPGESTTGGKMFSDGESEGVESVS